jgi:hypothetical protein
MACLGQHITDGSHMLDVQPASGARMCTDLVEHRCGLCGPCLKLFPEEMVGYLSDAAIRFILQVTQEPVLR